MFAGERDPDARSGSMNVIGFDDGPFSRRCRGDVPLIGALCAGTRLDGVLCGRVRRDGSNATRAIVGLIRQSAFRASIRAVLLQGIAVAGFNVVDIRALSEELEVPVLVVARRRPNLASIRSALFGDPASRRPALPGAARKWALIERAGPMEALEIRRPGSLPASGLGSRPQRLYVQRVGLAASQARRLVLATTLHGQLPEPVRLAHLIAGAFATGHSRGRA